MKATRALTKTSATLRNMILIKRSLRILKNPIDTIKHMRKRRTSHSVILSMKSPIRSRSPMHCPKISYISVPRNTPNASGNINPKHQEPQEKIYLSSRQFLLIPPDSAILQSLSILSGIRNHRDLPIHQSFKIKSRLIPQSFKTKSPDPDHFSISNKINQQPQPQSKSILQRNFLLNFLLL